ncbi:LamG domain-containing protein [Dolichospermum circinale]|uniref:LamG domain-containing protein n=1 Tax=Dolichospermum circinale TaxID=109265 RepID=UPI00232F1F05|nr:LamG domain-containing protein [Dolichospermum circinale]MDB9468881.1 LamG domain-containing protein [Dolichospermum circinale CS-539/09]MDB9469945.1 LamG domain-containing protein [Dolichospermum circinale CS-539]
MSLTSIITNSQNGSFDLLATQYTNLPSLANTSREAIKIAISATGQWYLLKPDFATNDPSLVKYKTPVDGDGHARDQNDQKFNFKYPQLNPGALVAEIKDLQGNTKSTVSGKQQSFELQPGDTVSFIINDDPKWYSNNAGKLTIGYSINPTTPITPDSLKPTPLVAIANLYNTGVDDARQVLGDSIPDPHYKLTTYPAGTVTPGVTTPNKDLAPINWVTNTNTARWIGPNTASAVGPVGNYGYITTFTLPNFSEASIVGELSVDDNITDIVLNGVSVGKPVNLSSWWTKISRFSISTGFVVGTNTLEFKLHSIGGPTGLRIDSISGTYKPVVTPKKVSVLSFDGKDDYVALPAVNNDYSQGFTVEAWVQYSSFQQSWSRIIDFGNGQGQNNIVLGHVGTSKDIGFHLYTTAAFDKIEIVNALEIGKWTHIAVTINKSREGKLYQNGQLVQSKLLLLPDNVNRKLNYIAKSNWSQDGYFEGKIAEVRVWNIARTPEEIKQNMNSRLRGNEPGLVGYYPLNGDANDKTSKANHGTINGAIWQQGEVPITG